MGKPILPSPPGALRSFGAHFAGRAQVAVFFRGGGLLQDEASHGAWRACDDLTNGNIDGNIFLFNQWESIFKLEKDGDIKIDINE
jgi:hypothetical protein